MESFSASPNSPFREATTFCLRCQEPLALLEPAVCPRCQLQFDPNNPETFRTSQSFLRWKFWLPAFCLALVSGVLSYAMLLAGGNMGVALFFSVPVSFGAVLGYGTRVGAWLLSALAAILLGGVVLAIVSFNLAGFFCGAVLAAMFVPTMIVGLGFGWGLRRWLKTSAWDQRHYLPLIGLIAFPYTCQSIESFWPRPEITTTVTTDITLQATPEEAWRSLQFYEEVGHEPPWLLRLALPRPIRSSGSKQRVGEVVCCRYDRGFILKQITEHKPGRRLAFDVLEQHLQFERVVTLRDGAFEIEPLGNGQSRVRLTTRYVRHLRPAWIWEPMEQRVIHDLHGHVLEGIRRNARPAPKPEYQPRPVPRRPDLAWIEVPR